MEVARTSFQAQNLNAFAERWARSIKHECLDKMIRFGGCSLERPIRQHVEHYNDERSRQGLRNDLIHSTTTNELGDAVVQERLTAVLSYHRTADKLTSMARTVPCLLQAPRSGADVVAVASRPSQS